MAASSLARAFNGIISGTSRGTPSCAFEEFGAYLSLRSATWNIGRRGKWRRRWRHLVTAFAAVAVKCRACQQHQGDGCGDDHEDRDQQLVQHQTRLQHGEEQHGG